MGEEGQQVGKDLLTLDEASRYLAQSGVDRDDWSGLPVPVPGLSLVLEPRYKHKALAEFRWKECYDEQGNSLKPAIAARRPTCFVEAGRQ